MGELPAKGASPHPIPHTPSSHLEYGKDKFQKVQFEIGWK